MDLILWLVLGGLAGWVASMIMGANANMGIVANIIVGIVGAAIGGFLASMVGAGGVTGFNFTSFLTAIIGAIVLLWLIQLVTGMGKTHRTLQ